MPLFDLVCNACHKVSEMLVRLQDMDTNGNIKLFKCPHCDQSVGYTKMLNYSTSFHLKGDGWYKDGYSSKKNDSSGKD